MLAILLRIASLGFIFSIVTPLTFELVYRYQLVDTYRGELYRFNDAGDVASSTYKKTVMFMGDSMTAGESSYPAMVREMKPDYRVINAAISGTGVVHAAIMAKQRFERFKPSIFVYQVYLGNDLFDVRYPINLKTISFLRNTYWYIAQRLRSVGYLNYKAGQVSSLFRNSLARVDVGEEGDAGPDSDAGAAGAGEFSVERYFFRDRIYYKAEPGLLEDTILVRPDRESSYRTFLEKLAHLMSYCRPDECRGYVLVIPHCSQVSRRYLERAKRLGAVFTDEAAVLRKEYPFIVGVRRFLDQAGMEDVTVLNPIGMLREREAAGEQMYRTNDPHLVEPVGYRAMAEYVMEETGLAD